MKIHYDPKIQAMYIKLAAGKYEVSWQLSDSVVIDEDKKGKVLGVEILDVPEILISKLRTRNTPSRPIVVAHKISR